MRLRLLLLKLRKGPSHFAAAFHLDADRRLLGPSQNRAGPFGRRRWLGDGEVVLRGGTVRRVLADLRRAAALLRFATSQMEGGLHDRRAAAKGFLVARARVARRGAGQHQTAPYLAGHDAADARPRADAGRGLERRRGVLLVLQLLLVLLLPVRHGSRPAHYEKDARVAYDDGQARQDERHHEQELLWRASLGVGQDRARADVLVEPERAPLAEQRGQQGAEAADPGQRYHQHQVAPLVKPANEKQRTLPAKCQQQRPRHGEKTL